MISELQHIKFIPCQCIVLNTIFCEVNSNLLIFSGQDIEYSVVGILDLTTDKLNSLLYFQGTVLSALLMPYEKIMLYSVDNIVKAQNIVSKQPYLELRHNALVTTILFCPKSKTIICGTKDGMITVWKANNGEKVFNFFAHKNEITSIICTKDEEKLVTSSTDGTIRVWNLMDKNFLFSLESSKEAVSSLAINPDETILASGSGDYQDQIKLWDIKLGKQLSTKFRSDNFVIDTSVTSLVFSRTGNHLVTSFFRDNYQVGLWNTHTGKNVALGKGFVDEVFSVILHPAEKIIISCGGGICGGGIDIWQIMG